MRLDGGFDVVLPAPVFRIGDVADAEHLLDFFPALIGDGDVLVLLINYVVAGQDLGLVGTRIEFFAALQLGNEAVNPEVLVSGFFAGAADDERRAGFVNQDAVNFVHDGEVVAALHAHGEIKLHVVAQVIEAEFVVGAIGDVGSVGRTALIVIQLVHNYADREPKEAVKFAHPFGVALGQVIVHRDHMHAAAAERV